MTKFAPMFAAGAFFSAALQGPSNSIGDQYIYQNQNTGKNDIQRKPEGHKAEYDLLDQNNKKENAGEYPYICRASRSVL
jgi:hypothetical protein